MNIRITFTLLLTALLSMSLSAQVIWGGPGDPNGEFDGGLNDWTTEGISSHVPDSSANAVWMWVADGIILGSLSGDTPIESESVTNGAMLFDSEFLDHGGKIEFDDDNNVVTASLGMGPAPAVEPGSVSGGGQTSILTSPTIDCTGENSVNLRFFSYFRGFNNDMYVMVSGDNGVTFDSIAVNTDDDLRLRPDNVINLDISEFAANKSEVVIQFKWSGIYYFWMIDDVSLLSLPGNNLAIDALGTFYSPASAVQPACAFDEDLIVFSTDLSNIGSDTVKNIVYKATVTNIDTDVFIYSDSIIIPSLEPGYLDSAISVVELWDPEILEQGVYRIRHEVYSMDNPDDFDPLNNTISQFFEISDMTFSKEITNDGSSGWYEDGNFYAVGALYTLGTDCMENYQIASVDYSVGRVQGDDEPLAGREVQFWLWKLKSNNFADFNFTENYEESITNVSHESMDFVAFAPDVLGSDVTSGTLISSDAPFLNRDGDETSTILEPGAKYGIYAHWGINGTTAPLHLMSSENDANDFMFYVQSDARFYTGFFESNTTPILRLQLELFSSVDDQPLSNEAFKVYPNPTNHVLNLELNLENSSDVTITIADITGKVLKYQNLSNVTRDIITLDVSNYASGNYIARVATEEGTKTLKFVVE